MSMAVGYARVSTQEQDLALQLDALQAAGGAQRDRPQLHAALDYMRPDDTLVVWKLDRLARSLRQLLDTVEALHSRQMGLRSLTEALDTRTPGGAHGRRNDPITAQFLVMRGPPCCPLFASGQWPLEGSSQGAQLEVYTLHSPLDALQQR